jgi:hypothetical protein
MLTNAVTASENTTLAAICQHSGRDWIVTHCKIDTVPGQLGGYFIWSNCASPTAMYDVLPLLRTLMPYTAILNQIRLLVPAKLDEHYESIRRGFKDGTLTAPACRSRKCNWPEQFRNSLAFLQTKRPSRPCRDV